MEIDRQALREVIADETRLVFGEEIPEKFLSGALGRRKETAGVLAFPQTTEEVGGILRYAHKRHIPVTPRGAGTNLVGSTVPIQGGIILDFSRMNRILELDEDTMTVTAEPGVLLQDLQAYVEGKGFFYPREYQHQCRRHAGSKVRRHP